MIIYLKFEDGKLIPAINGYNNITGLADDSELCLANGFKEYVFSEYSEYLNGKRELLEDGSLRDLTRDTEYIADKKSGQIENLTGQYTADKCERMVSWVATFINSITTATSLEDIKAKANLFKTKLTTLQSDYTTKCEEVANA